MSADHRRAQEKYDKLNMEEKAAHEELANAKHAYGDAHNKKKAQEQEQHDLDGQLRSMERNMDEIKREERTLTQAALNRVNVFGQGMAKVVAEISKERRWKDTPVGPLGMSIDVKDPRWTTAIESCLKAQLSSFLCTNHDDRKLLENISKRVKTQVGIIVQKQNAGRYATRPLAGCSAPTVESLLEISHPQVANALIDQAQIDVVVVCSDRDEGFRLLHGGRLKSVYMENGAQLQVKNGSESYNGFRKPNVSRLSSVDTSRLPRLQEDFAKCQQYAREMQHKIDECKAMRTSLDKEAKDIHAKINKLKKMCQSRNLAIEKLENDLKELAPTETTELDGEIELLEEDIQKLEESKNAYEKESAKVQALLEEAQAKEKAHVNRMIQMQEDCAEDTSELESKMREAKNKLQEQRSYVQDMKDHKAKLQSKHEDYVKRIEAARATLQQNTQGAIKYCQQLGLSQFETRPDRLDDLPQSRHIWEQVIQLEKRSQDQKKMTGLDPKRCEAEYRGMETALKAMQVLLGSCMHLLHS